MDVLPSLTARGDKVHNYVGCSLAGREPGLGREGARDRARAREGARLMGALALY